ncbi:hypothetical protein QQS21_010473 [Conoideocrella luteorostrata]|uniref:GRF-type domain-containing protein n=1 Tax=Conoideocrella luteorostrata TaxID=1105319 RepID=A0AAJ0CF44_9HYPO|nr:hypothetical protein QQS21_010473 [Conoideocrella luteorostrata]
MVSTTPPRKQYPASTLATPASHAKPQELPGSERKRLRGTWQDGQWWCNCEPRKLATLREVKKPGPNKGRFFWTCATYPFCDFFLWRDDAAVREFDLPAATLSVSDNAHVQYQPGPPRPKTPTFTQKPLESYGIQTTPTRRPGIPSTDGRVTQETKSASTSFGSTQTLREQPPSSSVPIPATPGSKRKRNDQNGWNHDDFSDLDSDEERQLAEIADRSAQVATPLTPLDDIFTTPATDRRTTDLVAGLPTPSVSRTLFPSSEVRRSKTVSFGEPVSSSALTTPCKTLFSHSAANGISAPSSPPDAVQDVTDQVMTLLKGHKVDPIVLQSVHKLLDTASRKTKGISSGRDAVRAALQKKDKEISRLQDEIRNLQDQAAFDQQNLTEAKRKIMLAYHDI